ncbi:MAG: heme-binding protein, partial [Xanthobacteraceae bacterium]
MSAVTLAQASTIFDAALKKARDLKQMPQTVVVLDSGGHVVCAKREDGSGIIRFEIAVGKAYGALGMGWGSRTMM